MSVSINLAKTNFALVSPFPITVIIAMDLNSSPYIPRRAANPMMRLTTEVRSTTFCRKAKFLSGLVSIPVIKDTAIYA